MDVEFKICPNCSKKIFKEDYIKDIKENHYITNENRLNYLWKHRKYCSYDCNTDYNIKKAKEKQRRQGIKIWTIKDGKITEIKVLLYGEWKRCLVVE